MQPSVEPSITLDKTLLDYNHIGRVNPMSLHHLLSGRVSSSISIDIPLSRPQSKTAYVTIALLSAL